MNSVEFANDLTRKFQSFCLSGKNPFGNTEYTQAAATIGDVRKAGRDRVANAPSMMKPQHVLLEFALQA